MTSTAFDRQVVRLQLLSSAIGKRVLDVAQRNSTLGRDPRVVCTENPIRGLLSEESAKLAR
jgi:hypothetical protein